MTELARETLVNRIMKNCKGEQLHWAGKMLVEERAKHTAGKLTDPRGESKELGDNQVKEGSEQKEVGLSELQQEGWSQVQEEVMEDVLGAAADEHPGDAQRGETR